MRILLGLCCVALIAIYHRSPACLSVYVGLAY